MAPPLSLLPDVGLAAVTFASTNVDDVFVLLAFFADATYSSRRVVIGQYLGIGALFAASLATSLIASRLPDAFLRALGVVPVLVGLHCAWKLRREAASGHEVPTGRGSIVGVALVTVASGGDNVAVYVPVFSTHMNRIVVFAVVFALMTAAWCWLAHQIVHHPLLGRGIRRWGRVAVPAVLILLGVYVLLGA